MRGVNAPVIGTCELTPNRGECAFAIHSAKIERVSDIHAVIMKFLAASDDPKKPDPCNLDWFVFEGAKVGVR
jgi:hypothetical protein